MSEPTFQPSPTLVSNVLWEEYQRPYVRDLAYVLACPNVLTEWLDFAPHQNNPTIAVHSPNFWQTQFEAYRERLNELDTTNAYQELTRYLLARPSPNRLGFHFEGLLSFWLEDGFVRKLHPYEMLASNVQLFCGKQTSGELDLILYNHREGITEHWELAIKFFMGSAPFAPVNWVGINSNDNLQRKITHMQTKQFRTVWVDTKDHGRVKIDKRYGVIKGRFFLPTTVADFNYPDWLEPSFPMHRWLAVPDNQNSNITPEAPNQDKNKIEDPTKDPVSNIETMTEPFTDNTNIRRAHYIEWFTQRSFYNKNKNIIKVPSNLATLPRGLYFIQMSGQESYEPLVILHTDVNVNASQNILLD
ncbi:DUF1853 family protein [Psychrobacter sp. 72-O-c]|uniref:DUF1853 family protein n=1 Tax=Psychrobacter sp. 72-O-c TaxID=2774125 RepID=UPI001D11AB46|nr:DUF1853 family protein [Psychrobacter sp. 72-O-c]